MAQKKKKSKISAIKRSNQLHTKLSKQGKLKKRRNKKKDATPKKRTLPVTRNEEPEHSDSDLDVTNMIEDEDISFLKKAVSNNAYSFLRGANQKQLNGEANRVKRKRKIDDEEVDIVEQQYEDLNQQPRYVKKKHLLPIKTSRGLVERSEDVVESEGSDVETKVDIKKIKKEDEMSLESKEVSAADLLASRQLALQKKKFRIGVLSSGLLENPEGKIQNFKPLLDMLEEKDPETFITVRKITLVSLLEVFKDLLPSYQIKHSDNPNVKLKKDVKKLHDFENGLVKAYKMYLQKIEKLISILKRRRGDSRVFKEPELNIAEMALQSLCDLLVTHPYFNFSKNIIHLLIPYLDHPKEHIRAMVGKSVKEIFKTDKRGEISLEIVRNINRLLKSRTSSIHPEVLLVFLALRLKDVNLDKEKEEELKAKKLEAKKQKILKMSKREKKRKKRFQELEKELLETKAEENVKTKEQNLTEITKLVFMMYFKVLKLDPSSKILNAALEGLAKFAHCINFEFYNDLIVVLDRLIENEKLGYKEKLCCVQTVFTILSYQGATINIDPLRFYSHLYANMFYISAGKNYADLPMILKITEAVLIKRQKHLSLQRLLAFVKRMATLALQVLPNGALGLLSLVKQIMQMNKSTDLLLDDDSSAGQGIYLPELEEPEYCNAGASALWELLPLQRHFHPTVQKYAEQVAKVNQTSTANSKNFLTQSAEKLFDDFDSSDVKFNPPVPAPRKFPKKKKTGLMSVYFEDYIKEKLSKDKSGFADISIDWQQFDKHTSV